MSVSPFTSLDLSKLAAPDVVEVLDFEQIRDDMLGDLVARWPEFSAQVASEPVVKLLEVAAYRELLLRQRVNEAARSVMLAFATGHDLEHLAALFGVERQLITAEDTSTIPPQPAVYESDDGLRRRTMLALEGFSTAGPVGAYIYHGFSASPQVKDVSVVSPSPGEVLVTVLTHTEPGVADVSLLDTVEAYLSADNRRPLTDHVQVQAVNLLEYQIDAELHVEQGPDPTVLQTQASIEVSTYINHQNRLGGIVSLSGIYAALHQPGVQHVTLITPTADVVTELHQAPYCTAMNVIVTDDDD